MRFNKLFLILTLVSIACNNKNDQEIENTDNTPAEKTVVKENDKPASGSLTGDTLNISGKLVVFFGPVEKNIDIQQPDKTLQQFKATSAALIDSLSQQQEIRGLYSTAGYFRIFTTNGGMMVISKSALNTEGGMLMSDGNQPPTIKKGFHSTEVLYDQIKTYFFLK